MARWSEQLSARLKALGPSYRGAAAAALYAEAEIELTEARRRTPVDTGALRQSGLVEEPTIKGDAIAVRIGFGGPAAPYAVYVHEDLHAFHPVGQAKFLESTIVESAPHLAKRVAARMRARGVRP